MLEFLLERIYKYRQIVRYIISGGTAALVNLVLLYIFTDIFKIWYLLSSILAFCVTFFVSFFLQKYWTFRNREQEKIYRQMGLYFVVAVTNLGLNTLLMYLSVDILRIWYLLAQVLVIAVIAVESFLIYKFLIFNRQKYLNPLAQDLKNYPKVLIATGIYPPDFRGPATMLEALPDALRGKGFEVKIITYSDIAATKDEAGRVYRILRSHYVWRRYFLYFWRLYRLAEWADVIYATDVYSVGHFTYWIKKITGRKYIIRFAGDSAWEIAMSQGWTQDYIVDFQKKTYGHRIEKLKNRRKKIMLAADGIIAVSNFIADIAKQIGVKEEKIRVIYNSIDFISVDEIKPETVEKIKTNYGEKSKIIVTACQLTPWKGVADIIKIMPALIKKIGNVNLLVLGEGQEKANLKQLAATLNLAEQVHFLGKIKRSDTMNYFRAADLFILNSNYEALSHTLLEVIKAGAPIVATNIGGNPEVIESGKEGLLVSYNNEKELLDAASRILSDNQLAKSYSANALQKLQKFNWAKNIEETIGVLKKVING